MESKDSIFVKLVPAEAQLLKEQLKGIHGMPKMLDSGSTKELNYMILQ